MLSTKNTQELWWRSTLREKVRGAKDLNEDLKGYALFEIENKKT